MKIKVHSPNGETFVGYVDGPNQRDAKLIACREVSGLADPTGYEARIVDVHATTPADWPQSHWQIEP
jgi:hypothetical protein